MRERPRERPRETKTLEAWPPPPILPFVFTHHLPTSPRVTTHPDLATTAEVSMLEQRTTNVLLFFLAACLLSILIQTY
jgi:hypothetical protein